MSLGVRGNYSLKEVMKEVREHMRQIFEGRVFLAEGTAHVKCEGPVVLGRASKGKRKRRPTLHLILLTVGYLALS